MHALIGVADETFAKELRARGARMFQGPVKYLDIVFAGFASVLELKNLPKLIGMIKSEGAIWAIYPKGHSEIKESDVRGAFRALEMKDVKVVAFSATHTSLKFVIPVALR